MGNCLTLSPSRSFASLHSTTSSSQSSFSSSTFPSFSSSTSMAPSSTPSSAAPDSKLDSTKILPFPALSDLSAHYKLGHELGRGQFGIIRLCTCRATGTQFACKSISKVPADDRQLHDILREVRIMQRLSRAASAAEAEDSDINIVRLYSVFEDATHVHLIMELCYGGELFDRIVNKKPYSEAQAASIMKSLMTSVEFCHRMGVMHRDLKPENILLVNHSDSSLIKLADFGLALEFSPGEKFTGTAGSACYIAPEVLKGEYSHEIDVWSAGVVLYVLLSGVPPFGGETDQDILDAIREGDLRFKWDLWSSISASAKDLVRRMLCPDVKARLTPSQVLEHPWILYHTKQASQTPHCQESIVGSPAKTLDAVKEDGTSASPSPLGKSCCLDDVKEQATEPAAVSGMQRIASLSSPKTCVANAREKPTCIKTSHESPLQASNSITTLEVDPTRNLFLTLGAKLNLPVPHDLAQMSVMEGGWSCTCLSVGTSEQIFSVEFGKKEYIVSFDCVGKKGWKILGQPNCKSVSRLSMQAPMHKLPECF